MKFKYFWIVFGLILGYGLLPVTLPDLTGNFEKPNTLLVRRQECGCPCAEGVIEKGRLIFSEEVKKDFPQLSERSREITLTNFPPFEIRNGTPEEFEFANINTFRVTGHTIGIDSIPCSAASFESVPKFEVQSWALASYYPRFLTFPLPITIGYYVAGILTLPTCIAFVFIFFSRKRKDAIKLDRN